MPPLAVPGVDVGAVVEHQAGHRVPAFRGGDQKGASPVASGNVRVGAGRDQRACAAGISRGGREQDRTEAVRGNRPDVGAGVDEKVRDGGMASGAGPHQGGLPHPTLRDVDLCPTLDQQPHQRLVPGVHGGHQWGVAAPARRVDGSPGVEQHPRNRRVAVAAGEEQRRLAILVGDVGVGPGLQQRIDDPGGVAQGGPGQRRRAVGSNRIDVGSAGDERGHGARVPPLHRLDQRGLRSASPPGVLGGRPDGDAEDRHRPERQQQRQSRTVRTSHEPNATLRNQ